MSYSRSIANLSLRLAFEFRDYNLGSRGLLDMLKRDVARNEAVEGEE